MAQKKWTITKTIPTMGVPDLQLAVAYYQRLGFELDWLWPEKESSHAGLCLADCSIMLALCEPWVMADVYFIVDDVAACFQFIQAGEPWLIAQQIKSNSSGANLPPARSLNAPKPPADAEYGLRDFSIIDPWGHQLNFGQPLVVDR